MAGSQPSRRVTPDMSSLQEGKRPRSLSKEVRASPQNPRRETSKTQSKASVSMIERSGSSEMKLSEIDSDLAWEDIGLLTWTPSAWLEETQSLETRAANAQAWENQVLKVQSRVSQQKQSALEVMTSDIKHRVSSKMVEEAETADMMKLKSDDSEVFVPRPLWPSKVEYILAQISFLMRPSSIWHFVFLWLHKGGCGFFIVYIFMVFLIGVPLLFLEMAVGQRARQSSISLWKSLGPWFGGVGYTSFLVCFITTSYVNVFNAWIFFYISHMFQFPVPWEKCPIVMNSTYFDPECTQASPPMYFWYRQTLKASDTIEDGGAPVFNLSLSLFLSWCLIGVFIIHGLKSIGKVLYVLMALPYFIIFCFLIRSLLLDGASYGLKYLLVLKLSSVYDGTVWLLAGIHVLHDMGLGFGPIVALASHMPDSNNCSMDAVLIVIIKIFTLLITTPFILSILGFWATVTTHRCCEKNTEKIVTLVVQGVLPPEAQPPVILGNNPTSTYNTWLSSLSPLLRNTILSNVPECNISKQFLKIKEGPRFAFLTFVEVTSFLPGSSLWSVLFFLLLLTLGLCTTLVFIQGITVPLQDTFRIRKQSKIVPVGTTILMFLCGLFFTRPPSLYFFQLLAYYWTPLLIIVIIMCENLAVAWAYGAKRFLADMTALIGRSIFPLYGWLWCYVTPVVLLVLFVSTLARFSLKPFTYIAWDSNTSEEAVRQFPVWALIFILALLAIVVLPILVYMAYCLIKGIPFKPEASPTSSAQSLPNSESQESP